MFKKCAGILTKLFPFKSHCAKEYIVLLLKREVMRGYAKGEICAYPQSEGKSVKIGKPYHLSLVDSYEKRSSVVRLDLTIQDWKI